MSLSYKLTPDVHPSLRQLDVVLQEAMLDALDDLCDGVMPLPPETPLGRLLPVAYERDDGRTDIVVVRLLDDASASSLLVVGIRVAEK